MLIAIIVFIFILGVLIFVHEAGHFVVAKRNGVKAEEFGFGFPPRIFSFQTWKNGSAKRGWRFFWGSKKIPENFYDCGTLYSLNLIPLGGFVKIKGENGEEKTDKDSFASKTPWVRTKILLAGVAMNFILGWFLISLSLMLGAPEPVENSEGKISETKIQIADIVSEAPAVQMGIVPGDEILPNQKTLSGDEISFKNIKDIQDYIGANKGKEMSLQVKRGADILTLKGTPRESYPQGEGALGIVMVETAIVKYSWYSAFWKGFLLSIDLVMAMLTALFVIVKGLFVGKSAGIEVAGPVGIASLTKQATSLGLVYVLQFAALLSINLGLINAFPFPALDGGRVFFILIEKIKGKPVSQKTEQIFHTVGFTLLIFLMILVTFKDVLKILK